MKIAFVTTSYNGIDIESSGGVESFAIYLLKALRDQGADITIFGPREIDMSLFVGIKHYSTYSISKDLDVNDYFLKNKKYSKQALNYSVFLHASFVKACKIAEKEKFDVIHFSAPAWYVPFISGYKTKIPIIITVHGHYLKRQVKEYIFNNFSGPHLVNISEHVEKRFGKYKKKMTIPNGVDLSFYEYNDKPKDYFAFLGRITSLKSVEDAIWSAKKESKELKIRGPIGNYKYFEKKIKLLFNDLVSFERSVNLKEKSDFLGNAKALLLPSYPFGFVPLEAMACGTPVIAYRNGCQIGSVVKDGVNGFLVDSKEEMAEKMKMIDKIDRKACREYVKKNFSAETMAERYSKYYKSLIFSTKQNRLE